MSLEDQGSVPASGSRAAVRRAMRLLLHRDRSEYELRSRLAGDGCSEEEIDEAVSYVASFGYLNDRRYAENYAISFAGKKSRRIILAELLRRGIGEDLAEAAVAGLPEDESALIDSLLHKRAGEPRPLEEAQKRRLAGYLMRRGFSQSDVFRALRRYESGD